MTTRINFQHNVDSVISDIDDVKDDIPKEMKKRVGAAMRVLWADVKQYVLDDPHASGDLFSSIRRDSDMDGGEMEFRVYTEPSVAPYAAVTEFGSGSRTGREWKGTKTPLPEQYPPEYPYTAPRIENIRGFAYFIEEWMRVKGISPDGERSYQQSALAIAKTIADQGTYAHPYMRPAWFDNELKIIRKARNAVVNAVR